MKFPRRGDGMAIQGVAGAFVPPATGQLATNHIQHAH